MHNNLKKRQSQLYLNVEVDQKFLIELLLGFSFDAKFGGHSILDTFMQFL
jgi:hypothetical protein